VKTYEDFKYFSWKKQGILDFDSVKNEVLEILAQNIYVKENKFRYPIEQKNRLMKTTYLYGRIKLNETMIDYFIQSYNVLLRLDIDRSNLYRSPKVKGDNSFMEKYMFENQKEVVGVVDLKREIPENKSFINRLMAKLHAV